MNKKIYFFFIIIILFSGLTNTEKTYGASCSDSYGFMAMEDFLSGGCTCMSGYVFGEDVLGNTTCVSGDTVCNDKYGYGSRYDSLSNSCECNYGYVLGKDSIGRTSCITETEACKNQYGYNAKSSYGGTCECNYGYGFGVNSLGDKTCVSLNSICTDKYGYNATYDSLSDKCACRSGHEFTQKNYGSGLECKSCFDKYGTNSSYDYISKSCGCDNGYTLKNNRCEKKQNNAYFTLLDVDTTNRQAIIQSDYDLSKYLIKYGVGCYSSSMERNVNYQIIVNLGTDFYLDIWDKIVLQDDNETCDILSEEVIYYDSFDEIAEEKDNSYTSTSYYSITNIPAPTTESTKDDAKNQPVTNNKEEKSAVKFTFEENPINPAKQAIIQSGSNIRSCPSITDCSVVKSTTKSSVVMVTGSYKDWYKISENTNNGLSGWAYTSLLNFDTNSFKEEGAGEKQTEETINNNRGLNQEKTESIFKKIKNWIFNLI